MVRAARIASLAVAVLFAPGAPAADRKAARPERSAPAKVPRVERWVDASQAEPGDGSKERPWNALEPALRTRQPSVIHLAPGRYRGSYLTSPGVFLSGQTGVVFEAPAGGVALRAEGSLSVKELVIEGGRAGIESTHPVVLEAVTLRDFSEAGLELGRGAAATIDRTSFETSHAGAFGIRAQEAALSISRSTFTGPFRRAIEAKESKLSQVTEVRIEGAETGLHVVGGEVSVTDTRISGGKGAALYVSRAPLSLRNVEVEGHEFGLLTGTGAELDVVGLRTTGSARAGIAVVKSRGRLRAIVVRDSKSYAGLQLIASTLRLEDVQVVRASGIGIYVSDGVVELVSARIDDVSDPEDDSGNAVEVRRSTLKFGTIDVRGAAGTGLYASEVSRVEGKRLVVQRAKWSAIAVDQRSEATVASVEVHTSRGAALTAIAGSTLKVARLKVDDTLKSAVWTPCENGDRVTVGTISGGNRVGLEGSCVTLTGRK